ncbi:CotH kinase family protein [Paenibacillus sp. 481]|uniref:CotH kinase family protein n=1 Tax=Paenibacillus sp. 481 TaxID=2835869 RepID=UPI001E642F17|nr:CotH kinase family protein [Paenibacillus sp. 481]UHA75197.1 CotH kinase family protein [Paenibacillus sp. 481]
MKQHDQSQTAFGQSSYSGGGRGIERCVGSVKAVICLLLAITLLAVAGCTDDTATPSQSDEIDSIVSNNKGIMAADSLVENKEIYRSDRGDHIVHLYLTIAASNKTNVPPVTWAQLSSIMKKVPGEKHPEVDVIFQEGNATGPVSGMFGYSELVPNGTATVRGASSLRSPQKSYKVKLIDDAGLWRDQRVINLVKHSYDLTRVRNKLSFDLLKHMPDITSLRTQFVHLHVRDLTASPAASTFQDYGLYTQIEQPNKRFLLAHGLDPSGHLYKAVMFEFFRYKDKLRTEDEPQFDKDAFESVLEVQGSNDHKKLLAMLDDVNDISQDIDSVVDKHFDRDNFLTWTALNILFDNMDTNTQNFLLYSPLNSEKWYFLPWDYDGAWGDSSFEAPLAKEPPVRWRTGVANYWNNVLQSRFFKKRANVEQLTAKVDALFPKIKPELVQQYLNQYRKVAPQVSLSSPDLNFLPGTPQQYKAEWARLATIPAKQIEAYKRHLEWPMPFFLGEAKAKGTGLAFNWGNSYDLQGDSLTYRFELSKSPNFDKPLTVQDGLRSTTAQVNNIQPGKYFWRVFVFDAKGNKQHAFDTYRDANQIKFNGVKQIFVERKDGTLVVPK